MAGDPITTIKEELKDASVVLERLQQAIESSNQKLATAHYQDVTERLEKILSKIDSEFGWLAPTSIEEE